MSHWGGGMPVLWRHIKAGYNRNLWSSLKKELESGSCSSKHHKPSFKTPTFIARNHRWMISVKIKQLVYIVSLCYPQDAMEVMGVVAVMVNLALLGTGGSLNRMFPNMTTAQRILLIVILEVRLLLNIHQFLMNFWIHSSLHVPFPWANGDPQEVQH